MGFSSTPTRRVLFIGTGGILHDVARAAELRDALMPPTALPGLTTIVLDLSGMTPTPAALRELIVPLCHRIRNGEYGETKLVLATPDAAVGEVVGLLAAAHDLPVFLARSSDAADVAEARAAGALTATEHETLAGLRAAGGGATAAQVASTFDIAPTAANNRLTNLSRKGYVHRYHRARPAGDVFIDPRAPAERDAQPRDTTRLRVEGEAAERALEILRRRRS